MPWILNLAYILLLISVSPVLVYRAAVLGKYRDGWRQKLLGQLPRRNGDRPCVWLHAVSVGEVLQLTKIVEDLQANHGGCDCLISTTTSTGFAVAQEKFPKHQVCYFPLDFSWAVNRALRRVQPVAVVLVELELWPNFILAARRNRIPLALINGRISEHSFRGYRRIRWLMRRLLRNIDAIAVQNRLYANRLIELGATRDRMQITGSVKFDHIETDRGNAKTAGLRSAFGLRPDEPVLIAGSTQAPEEEYALDAWAELRQQHPTLRLVLVPRHKERFDEVAQLVESRSLPLVRRSRIADRKSASAMDRAFDSARSADNNAPVLLLDTLGELAACWGLADIAFVGGSLTNRGGQNMIEPAAYGAAVLFGPNTENFQDVADALLAHEAARVVADRHDLSATAGDLLQHPTEAREQGRRAQEFVLSQQGATRKTIAIIGGLIRSRDRQADSPTRQSPKIDLDETGRRAA